jgi:hypothetical protein
MSDFGNSIANDVIRIEVRRVVGVVAIGLWGLSLLLPATQEQVTHFFSVYGLQPSTLGWLDLIKWQFTCLATLGTVAACCMLFLDGRPYRWIAWVTILLPAETLAIALINGAGSKYCPSYTLEAGFYVWLAACILVGFYILNEDHVLKWLLRDKE